MSNVNPRNSVIVRAYADEPIAMVVIGAREGAVEVAQQGGAASINLPTAAVFEMDRGRLLRLREAFAAGEAARLRALWEKATPYAAV